jgi:hypothetical protein
MQQFKLCIPNTGSKSSRGGYASAAKRSIPVTCLDDGRNFVSVAAAARHYELNPQTVKDNCFGVVPSVNGRRFGFGYASEYVKEELSTPEFKELKDMARHG